MNISVCNYLQIYHKVFFQSTSKKILQNKNTNLKNLKRKKNCYYETFSCNIFKKKQIYGSVKINKLI